MNNFYAVVMAGGKGKRFWPFSRRDNPKQFLSLITTRSLIEETIKRLSPIFKKDRILVVTARKFVNLVSKKMPEVKVLGEPVSRNTAPCIGYAAIFINKLSPNAQFCVLPSDHYISPKNKFQETLSIARHYAKTGKIVLIGIKPTFPSTNYGYIQKGVLIDKENGIKIFGVKGFYEKPSAKKATRFIKQGDFYWNSGIFVWNTNTILDAIKRWMPHLYKGLLNLESQDSCLPNVLEREYKNFEDISIDYAILEREDKNNMVVIEANFEWDDLGSFVALSKYKNKDENKNIVEGLHCGIDTKNSIIFSNNHLIGTIGLGNMVVIHTKDVTLICPKNRCNDIKKLYDEIAKKGFKKFL